MELKICSYNLRMDTPRDGINAFFNRTPLIAEKLAEYQPDVIGFQEVRPPMRRWLEENLEGYTIIGTGRGADFLNEANVIAYRTDKFLTMSLDTFWLSDTPYVPGSMFTTDQSDNPRICTWYGIPPSGCGSITPIWITRALWPGSRASKWCWPGSLPMRSAMPKHPWC